MSSIVPCLGAACAAALLTTAAPGFADTFATKRLPPAIWQRAWQSPARSFSTLPDLRGARLPLTIRPVVAAWWTPPSASTLKLELIPIDPSLAASPRSVDLLAGLSLPDGVPPLIRYTDEATDVTLSISPGSPCTAACLKVAGSF
jgi:hypothetical protein